MLGHGPGHGKRHHGAPGVGSRIIGLYRGEIETLMAAHYVKFFADKVLEAAPRPSVTWTRKE